MIIYCCADLIFSTKVRSTADSLNIKTRPARDAETLRKRLDRVDDGKGNDAVVAVLIDLDLGEAALELITQTKQHAANPPVVAFGSHVATDILRGAHDRGAEFVMSRGQFTAHLPTILQRFVAAP